MIRSEGTKEKEREEALSFFKEKGVKPEDSKWDFWGKELDDKNITFVLKELSESPHVTFLDLGKNNIGVQGAKAIVKSLSTNSTLVRLDLGENQLGDEGAIAILNLIATKSSLQELVLGDNDIGDTGAKAIANLIASNLPLNQLYLWSNKIGTEGVKSITTALHANATLETLSLDANPVYDDKFTLLLRNLFLSLLSDQEIEKRRKIHDWVMGKGEIQLNTLFGKEEMKKQKHIKTIVPFMMRRNNFHKFLDLCNANIVILPLSDLGLTNTHVTQIDWKGVGTNCPNLEIIDLSENKLTAIPSCLSSLPNLQGLKEIRFKKNAFQGFTAQMNQKDVFAFLETLSNSEEVNYDGVKLMVVGEAAAGKTTLIKALGGVEGNKLQKEKNVSTDGVDLGSLEFSKEKVYFSVWDFGGQEIYRYTHQLFLSNNSVCAVVFDLRTAVDETVETLTFWFQILAQRAPGVKCLLVGTHGSTLSQAIAQSQLDQVAEKIRREESGCLIRDSNSTIMIDSISGLNLPELKNMLITIGKAISETQKVPGTLVEAHHLIKERVVYLKERNKIPVVDENGFRDCLSILKLPDRTIKLLTRLLCRFGAINTVEWTEFIGKERNKRGGGGGEKGEKAIQQKMLVVLEPKWLTELLTTIVTFKYNLTQGGILFFSKLFQIWRSSKNIYQREHLAEEDGEDAASSYFFGLLKLLKDLNIVLPLDEERLLVPCLLPDNRLSEWPSGLKSAPKSQVMGGDDVVGGNNRIKRSFLINKEGKTLSTAIVARLHGILLKIPGAKCVTAWKTGCIVRHSIQVTEKESETANSLTELVIALYKESIFFSETSQASAAGKAAGEEKRVGGGGSQRDAIHLIIGMDQKRGAEEDKIGEQQKQSGFQKSFLTARLPSNQGMTELVRSLVYTVETLLADFSFESKDLTQIIPLDDFCSDWLEFEKVKDAVTGALAKQQRTATFSLRTTKQNQTKKINLKNVLLLCPDLDMGNSMNFIPRKSLELGRILGDGAFGVVYEGIWKKGEREGFGGHRGQLAETGNKVAVKQLKTDSEKKGDVEELKAALSMMQREVYLNSVCQHPNIVALCGVCFEPDHPALFVMEFLGGGDLLSQLLDPCDLIKEMDRFLASVEKSKRTGLGASDGRDFILATEGLEVDLQEKVKRFVGDIAQIMKLKKLYTKEKKEIKERYFETLQKDGPLMTRIGLDVATGLSYLHNLTPSIVHRDIKSPNIFLTEKIGSKISIPVERIARQPLAKIGDFGLSVKLDHSLTSHFQVNLRWAAIETIYNGTCTTESDVYALGFILWETKNRSLTLAEINDAKIGAFRRKGTLPVLLSPEEMNTIVLQCLSPCTTVGSGKKKREADSEVWRGWYDQLCRVCWHSQPRLRPSAEQVAGTLQEMAQLQFPELNWKFSPLPKDAISKEEEEIISSQNIAQNISSATSSTIHWKLIYSVSLDSFTSFQSLSSGPSFEQYRTPAPQSTPTIQTSVVNIATMIDKWIWVSFQTGKLIVGDSETTKQVPVFDQLVAGTYHAIIPCKAQRETVWCGSNVGIQVWQTNPSLGFIEAERLQFTYPSVSLVGKKKEKVAVSLSCGCLQLSYAKRKKTDVILLDQIRSVDVDVEDDAKLIVHVSGFFGNLRNSLSLSSSSSISKGSLSSLKSFAESIDDQFILLEFAKKSDCREMCKILGLAVSVKKEKDVIPLVTEENRIVDVIALAVVNGLVWSLSANGSVCEWELAKDQTGVSQQFSYYLKVLRTVDIGISFFKKTEKAPDGSVRRILFDMEVISSSEIMLFYGNSLYLLENQFGEEIIFHNKDCSLVRDEQQAAQLGKKSKKKKVLQPKCAASCVIFLPSCSQLWVADTFGSLYVFGFSEDTKRYHLVWKWVWKRGKKTERRKGEGEEDELGIKNSSDGHFAFWNWGKHGKKDDLPDYITCMNDFSAELMLCGTKYGTIFVINTTTMEVEEVRSKEMKVEIIWIGKSSSSSFYTICQGGSISYFSSSITTPQFHRRKGGIVSDF